MADAKLKFNDGDEILLGGTSSAKFYVGEKKIEKTPAATERENSAVSNNEAAEKIEEAMLELARY